MINTQTEPDVDAGIFGALQTAAITAVTTEQKSPLAMSAIYQQRRDLMVETLRDVGLDARPQRATPFLWVPTPEGQSSRQFCDRLLDRAGVVVSPGNAFGAAGEGFFRVALMVPDGRLREAAERIRGALVDGEAG